MKSLLLLLLAALTIPTAVSANSVIVKRHGYYRGASDACFEWMDKGGKFKYLVHNQKRVNGPLVREVFKRNCLWSAETKEFLGVEKSSIDNQSSSWPIKLWNMLGFRDNYDYDGSPSYLYKKNLKYKFKYKYH